MNLLIISNNLGRASFRQRTGIYLDTLRKNGVDFEVAKLPGGFFGRRKLFKKGADFDGVFLHKKTLNIFDAHCLREYSKKIIYDFDDAVMYRHETPEYDSISHFGSFRRTVRLADMVIAGNSYLAEHAKRFNNRVEILPTGLDTGEYKNCRTERKDNKIRLVWIGSKSTLPYLVEITPALEEIGSRFGNVILRIISDDFFDLQNMEVEKCRWQKQTETTELVTSDIGLSPLPDDRFTKGKCGFKILQYAAAGLPVVASPVGTNVDYVRDGITGFHVTNNRQWVDKITQLIEDPQLRTQMGENGRDWVKNFDAEIIGKQFVGIIKQVIQD
jgi:hypothetical protein